MTAFDLSDRAFVEKLVGESIVSYSLTNGTKAGDNAAGDLKAIQVATKTGRVLHLIHKTYPLNPVERERVRNFRIFRVENQFYSSLKTEIEQLIPNSLGYEIPTAKFYSGMNDDENDYITMEDLRSGGYKMYDKFQGLGLREVSKILEILGKFHATGYYFIKTMGEEYFTKKYPLFSCGNIFLGDFRKSRAVLLQAVHASTCEIIKEQEPELGSKISKYAGSDLNSFRGVVNQIIDLTDAKMFPTVVHGDLWINNILIKDDPLKVKFVDFQMTRRGNIYEDLVYFILTSTTSEFRQNYLGDVLPIYFDNFAKFLNQINCKLPPGFTKGNFIDGFYSLMVPGFLYMTFAIPFQLGMPLDVEEIMRIQRQVFLEDGIDDGKATFFTLEQRTRFLREKLRRETKASPEAITRLVDLAKEVSHLF